jgi:hypothetical protein
VRLGAGTALALGLVAVGCSRPDIPSSRRTEQDREAPAVRFEPSPLDLGRTVPGGEASGSVMVRNGSDAPITVVAVEASCECTVASVTVPRELAPGEAFELPVTLSLAKFIDGGLAVEATGPTRVTREVMVRTLDGTTATVPVTLEVSDLLVVDPPRLAFGDRILGHPARATIEVRPGKGLTGQRLEVLGVVPGDPRMQVTMTPTEVGGATLHVEWPSLVREGPARSMLRILTNVPPDGRVDVPVEANVVPAVWVHPDRIDVPAAPPDQPVVRRVVIGRADGQAVEVTGIGTNNGRVKYHVIEPRTRPEREVEVVVPVPPPPGVVDAVLLIRTDVPGAGPIELPVHVATRPP